MGCLTSTKRLKSHPNEVLSKNRKLLLPQIVKKCQTKRFFPRIFSAKHKKESEMKTGEINRTPQISTFPENDGEENEKQLCSTPSLHKACRLTNPQPHVDRLLADGASANQRDSCGQTPLHVLIREGHQNSSCKSALECLLWSGANLWFKDNYGETPLMSIKELLKGRRFDTAVYVAKLLLEAGAEANTSDLQGNTLLFHSLQYLDESYELTKLLLNYGSSVWGLDSPSSEDSAFSWLLQGVMRRRKLSNCDKSLEIIGQLMSAEPLRMKMLVVRIMNRNTRCYQIYGPLFNEIYQKMEKFWRNPQKLTHLSRIKIREALRESPQESVSQLRLPPLLQNFFLFNDVNLKNL